MIFPKKDYLMKMGCTNMQINDIRLKHNSQVLVAIASYIDEMPYGSITFTLRLHDGYVTDVMKQSYERKRFDIKKD